MSVPEQPVWFDHARRALSLAVRGEGANAGEVVSAMAVQHGPDSVPEAMRAWIDTMLQARGIPELGDGAAVHLGFVDVTTGAIGAAGDVPAATAWAGQMIAARAALDSDGWRALIMSSTPENWAVRVCTLLSICALNVRAGRARPRAARR